MKHITIVLLALFAITGCTSALWEPPTFTEKVTGYYVVPDKDLLIIGGDRYSYIFNISEDFKDILSASHEFDFQPTYDYFKINDNNTVTGVLKLTTDVASDSLKAKVLLGLGFTKASNGLAYKTRLSGKLYQIEGELQVTSFDKEQLIIVEEPEGGISKVGKIVVTPVAVTADAIAVVSVLSLLTVGYYSAIVSE
ncbi:hypothetical protein KP803_00005 [Vibrio sp. ZSDE26]|uniref:Uncharacterized protein n=1 Tax=Vibrio amylolyticus TaxID=2847292 RepID=A0A9X2BFB4_9VIBR|nr:hypothetical protein [Vibrio amylolyticus]MCK6261649.1 hypothetical protein [Vibrio amylolyticus]